MEGLRAQPSDFEDRLAEEGLGDCRAVDLDTFVVSVTLRCNQGCRHCHVSSGPTRTETMSSEVMSRVLELVGETRPAVVDVTGGAPELNPELPDFLSGLHSFGRRVRVRTNLTVLEDEGYHQMANVYAACDVDILASLPSYTALDVDAVRGKGVLEESVSALRHLNDLGYGVDGGRRLDLVYNPVGTNLPEPQAELEALFHEELERRFGVVFSHLLTMTNMPVGRFRECLAGDGGLDRYVRALRESFNPQVLPRLQCRHEVEIGWDGRLYDCDFNLGEGRPLIGDNPSDVWDFDAAALATRRIAYGTHCFGCTAGAGSS